VLNGEIVFPKAMPLLAKDLVRSILLIDPGMRATIKEIKKHKYFRDYDWEAIHR